MYALTLTKDERKAIDWIGNRYAHGYDLYNLLWGRSDCYPNDADWDADCDMTFITPENVAQKVNKMGEECEYRWDCFAPDLCEKLNQFCASVVRRRNAVSKLIVPR